MWIATAGRTTWVNGAIGGLVSEAQAFEAFAFLNWIARKSNVFLPRAKVA